MATTDGMYYEGNIPLGLFGAIRGLLGQQQSSPNTPNIPEPNANRVWFSQPRPASRGSGVPKPTFFYATGTASIIDLFGTGYGQIGGGQSIPVQGLDGQVLMWDGAITNDPFWRFLDADLWNAKKIDYAAAIFPIGQSITEGVMRTVDAINDTPGAFALGGYSQGAAVMGRVYDEIRFGRLRHRRGDLIAGITFGSPVREAGHLWPGANPVGSWDQPTNYNSHGCFPLNYRLKNTESFWWDFSNENEIISSVGNSTLGQDWVDLAGLLLSDFNGNDIAAFILSQLSELRFNVLGDALDVIFSILQDVGDVGHIAYPSQPPPGNPQSGKTSYQIALQYLRDVGKKFRDTRAFNNITEVVQINFKQPLPVSDLNFQAIQVPCQIEAWYKDRQENWRAVLDEDRNPVTLSLGTATEESWFSYHGYLTPIVAKSMQLRLTRVPDDTMGNRPYCVGLKNVLIRRNIYDRPDGIHATVINEDALGNVVETTVKDWDPPQAIDNNPATFWRSAPMPDPNAVVYLCLDLRKADGSPQVVDTVFLDPVYTGGILNLYYSNDDAVGTRQLSPISVAATTKLNTQWRAGRGIWDISTGLATAAFSGPFKVGPLVSKDCWIGVEWIPDFKSTSPPNQNPMLFEVVPTQPLPGQFWPKLYYNVINGSIVLEMTNGTTSQVHAAALTTPITQDEPVRIVAGWSYEPGGGKSVFISVRTPSGDVLGETSAVSASFPTLVTLDGEVGFSKFRGTFRVHVIKLEKWTKNLTSFMANPMAFVDPDVVMPDSEGKVLSSSLDDAIYACDWTVQDLPTGGSHPSEHAERRWTPIWRDYTVERGRMYLPEQVSMKYLKLEFTKLTAEPYPIYDSGIQVRYETYPTSVEADVTTTTTSTSTKQNTTITHHPGLIEQAAQAITGVVNSVGSAVNGLLGNIGNLVNGISHVNWLDPNSVAAAINATASAVVQPVLAAFGSAAPTGAVPNSMSAALSGGTSTNPTAGMSRQESTSVVIQRRPLLDVRNIAGQALKTLTGTEPKQLLGPVIPSNMVDTISKTFTPAITAEQPSQITPAQGTDWWLFPGGLLKLPAAIMNGLTGLTQVITGYDTATTTSSTVASVTSTTRRVRFDSVEIHRYRTRVIIRDAAVGYFAGIREVAAYNTNYIANEDPVSFKFTFYTDAQWSFTNIRKLDSGPVTTKSDPYVDADVDTLINLDAWTKIGNWEWDGAQDDYSGTRTGSAKVTANGNYLSMFSKAPIKVTPGHTLVLSSWIKHVGAQSPTGANLADNPGFESSGFWLDSATRSGTYSHSGSYSARIISTASYSQVYATVDADSIKLIPGAPGDTYYAEVWVHGDPANTQTGATSNYIGLYAVAYDEDEMVISYPVFGSTVANTVINEQWVKISGYITLPDGCTGFGVYAQMTSGVASGEMYYFDDFVIRKSGQVVMDLIGYDEDGVKVGEFALTPVQSNGSVSGYNPPEWLNGAASITTLQSPTGNTDGVTFSQLLGTWNVPSSGVDFVSLRFRITSGVTAGDFWVAHPQISLRNGGKGYLYNKFTTASDFAKVTCDFRDSGLVRSDAMWARMDPLNTNIDKTTLSWYTFPSTMPPGMWGDTFGDWADYEVKWGNARATVAIVIDPNRVYKGNRVLHFYRAAGAGEAGIKVTQRTNYVPGSMARIGCVFYKPNANGNTITLRLRRVSDGVYLHEEEIAEPPTGQWFTYLTPMFDVPDSLDQVYYVEFTSTGQAEDDIYVSDLFTQVALIRYQMQLGGAGAPMLDVTEMAHTPSDAIVTATDSVKEMAVNVVILSDRAVAFGSEVTPAYLK